MKNDKPSTAPKPEDEDKRGFDGPDFDAARGYTMDHANGHPWYGSDDYTYQNYKRDKHRQK